MALTTTNINNTENFFTEQQVYSQIGTRINYIVDGDFECKHHQESTIVHFKNNDLMDDRDGVIAKDKLLNLIFNK